MSDKITLDRMKLSDKQEAYLIEIAENPGHWKSRAAMFNEKFGTDFTKHALRKKYARLVNKGTANKDGRRDLYAHLVNTNDALIASLRSEKAKTAAIVEACISSIAKLDIKHISRPRHRKPRKRDLELHLLRSDAQVGEVVKPEGTSGLGAYDFDIYKRRVLRLLEKVLLFHEQDSPALGLRKLVSPQLGDHVEGEAIYKGQSFYIDRPLVDQVFQSLEFEVNQFWLPLAREFDEMELFCVVGNHGRGGGGKGQAHNKTNWDYVYYRSLKYALETAAPHVKVHVSESPIMLVKHGESLFCYKHGDDSKSWMGIPYYGLERSARRATRMFQEMIRYTCVGHFHTPANLDDGTLLNGTLVGGSDLSINRMGLTSIPSQKLFCFDKTHGVNRVSELYLDDAPVLEPNEFGILTPVAGTCKFEIIENAQ